MVVNMHKLTCGAMLELTPERVHWKALRYVSTLAEWRYCEIFGSADHVLWIERPDEYQRGRPERQRIRNSARATPEQQCVMHLRVRDRTFFENHLATALFDSVGDKTQTARHYSRETLHLSANRCEWHGLWHPRCDACSGETHIHIERRARNRTRTSILSSTLRWLLTLRTAHCTSR